MRRDAHPSRPGVGSSAVTAKTCEMRHCARRQTWDEDYPSCASQSLHSLGSEAASAGVVGPPVHALLHIVLVGVALVGELLLGTRELGGVHPRVVSRHARAHGVAPWVHGVVAVGHGVPQHLGNQEEKVSGESFQLKTLRSRFYDCTIIYSVTVSDAVNVPPAHLTGLPVEVHSYFGHV